MANTFEESESFTPLHRRLPRAGRIELLPGYADGSWWVQDLAASIAADLLGIGKDRTVLDLCAAPGGKTMQLAVTGWRVIAVDSSAKRLDRLRENLARTQLEATLVTADLMHFAPEASADAVLLDAPCSATGTFRRHPDVLHRIGDADIATLAQLQTAMVARAAGWVKPGGTLVYATCSLEPAEGEAIITAFLAANDGWRIDAVRTDELPTGITPAAQGWVRTLPVNDPATPACDGFFIARLTAPDA